MSRTSRFLLIILAEACASTVLAYAQAASSQTEASIPATSSPVAYIYVDSIVASNKTQIDAYAAASNGRLTKIAGSPFPTTSSYMALNGKWLFATNGIDIYSYSIASNGALKRVDSYTAGSTGGGPVRLFLDHTGASLYDGYANLMGTGNNGYQAYSINQTTGKITLVNQVVGGPEYGNSLSFISNNEYAYSSSCYHFTPSIYGMKRESNGAIIALNINPAMPTAPAGEEYCPFLAAADMTGHVAVAVQPMQVFAVAGPYQIATYTANSSGNLTTASTYSNMPKTGVGNVNDIWMAPSGNLLAVAGTTGLQVFHFNGANPATHYTGLLTTSQVDQVFWDNANHLYAIGQKAGKLWVFTVTATTVSQAPGSPYSIAQPIDLIVWPKP
jgi:6-phosphogluconolactonase (cycloisomerase 2 family)